MKRSFKPLFLTVLGLLVTYVLVVQVLRWLAFGDEERAALAVMEVAPVPPAGESGFKYLAYPDLGVPEGELDAALAADLEAFRRWHATAGERFATTGDVLVQPPALPSATRYPPRAAVAPPDAECGFRGDCLGKLRGHEEAVRAWLDADAQRLALAGKALAAAHFLNPYPHDVASPLANFRLLRLPINHIALQALEGDVAGALPRACTLLADSRRHLRNDAMLIEKIVTASLAEGAGQLVADLRALDPALPLPGECKAALQPVHLADYQICGALRTEYAMMAELSRQTHAAMDGWRLPTRWVLYSDKLQRAWTASHFAPMCTAEGQAAIARGEIPDLDVQEFNRASVDFWAAPISNILASLASPAYGDYQQRLLDHAEALRGHLAVIEATRPGPEPNPGS